MPPDIYTPVRKLWGTSTVCYRDESIEVVRIVVLPGGFCSRHLHRKKSNQFVLVKGELQVFRHIPGEQNSDGLPTMEIELLKAEGGERTQVTIAAGVEHRFRSPRWGQFDAKGGSSGGAIAYEIYTASPGERIDPEDIERFDEGGRE